MISVEDDSSPVGKSNRRRIRIISSGAIEGCPISLSNDVTDVIGGIGIALRHIVGKVAGFRRVSFSADKTGLMPLKWPWT